MYAWREEEVLRALTVYNLTSNATGLLDPRVVAKRTATSVCLVLTRFTICDVDCCFLALLVSFVVRLLSVSGVCLDHKYHYLDSLACPYPTDLMRLYGGMSSQSRIIIPIRLPCHARAPRRRPRNGKS